MNFRNVSSWCIRNPVFPIVLFVGLMLAGIVAFARMQVNNAPDVDFPAAIVSVTQPGAAPNELETQVTQRVESAIRGVNGVEEISSTVSEGNSFTFVNFQLGTPTDRAVNDVRNVIAQIRGSLPEGILEPQVTRVDANGEPISYIGAQATDMTLEELSWYIDNTIAKRLLGLPGIAAVERVGGVDRVIRVVLDPAALQAQGITAAQVNQQLRQSNMNGAGGRAEIAGSEQSVRVLGNAADAYQLSQTQIALPGGRFVKLADLGTVKDSNSEQRSIAKQNGHQVVTFMIQRAKGASEVTAYESMQEELKKLEKENPKVHFSEIFTSVDYTKAQYRSAMEGLVEGAVLAVLVVLLFLRDIRATAISAVSIPLSAIPAFAFMSMMGITMNFMSTMAMGLVAGVLVDDAIVEIENIVRHMRMGKSGYQAALDAADEIGLAVLATTMAIVAVFFPVALMPGIAGQYFKAFGFTVVLSVLMSLFVARMITPLISAYFLRSKGAQPHAAWKWMDVYLKVLNWSLDTTRAHALLERLPKVPRKWGYIGIATLLVLVIGVGFVAGTAASMKLMGTLSWNGAIKLVLALLLGTAAAYGVSNLIGFLVPRFSSASYGQWHAIASARWNARLQDHRLVMVAAGAATLLLSVVLFGTLSTSFFPPQNSDYSRANITMAPGSTLEDTEKVVDKTAAIISKDPSVDRVFERVNVGEGHVNIVLKKHREMTSTEFERNLSPALAAIADARVSFQSQNGGGPDPDSRDIMLYLGGEDPAQLEAVANEIAKEMETVPGLRAPRVGSNLAQPEITIKPRFDLAADLGVTTAALSQTIRIATLGEIEQNSAKFSLSDRQVPIQVSLSESDRRDLSTLQNLPVPTAGGGSVPLKAVAEIGFGSGPTTINRSNQLRRLHRRRPGAGRRRRRRLGKGQRAPRGQEAAAGRREDEPRQPEMAVRASVQLRDRLDLGRAAGVRGAGPPLPPVPRAVRQHGLADPCAARSGDSVAHRPTARVAVRSHRHPDAVRDRREELDPSRRLRGRDDEPRHAQEPGDLGSRAQARPADRHDDGRDGRGHAPHGDLDLGRQQLARSDGNHRHRRPHFLDAPDFASRARLFLHRHLDGNADRQAVPPFRRFRGPRHGPCGAGRIMDL